LLLLAVCWAVGASWVGKDTNNCNNLPHIAQYIRGIFELKAKGKKRSVRKVRPAFVLPTISYAPGT
jgi:hypothetical protein